MSVQETRPDSECKVTHLPEHGNAIRMPFVKTVLSHAIPCEYQKNNFAKLRNKIEVMLKSSRFQDRFDLYSNCICIILIIFKQIFYFSDDQDVEELHISSD